MQSPTSIQQPVLKVLVLGLIGGVTAGFFGIGGGIVMVPLILYALKGDQHTAHATSLGAIVLISLASMTRYAIDGSIEIGFGIALGIGGIVGSMVGATVMNRVSAGTLRIVFSIVLVVVGLRMIVPMAATAGAAASPNVLWGGLIGLFAGVASGLAGIGGGVVMVPIMVLGLGFAQHIAQGTSSLAIIFTSMAGTRINILNKRIDLRNAVLLGLGGAVTGFIGAWLAGQVDSDSLRRYFGVFVLISGIRMAFRAIRARRAETGG